jgi:hypothetical protein
MRDVFGSGTILGYCTNVHAGATYDQTLANLEKYAVRVKALASPGEPMGVGLWLSARAARQVLEQDRVGELRDWLESRGLLAYTFNGFPHGDFHQAVVKFKVYQPDWSEQARLAYSIDLANIVACLLPEGAEGSISTSPVGWGTDFRQSPEKQRAAAFHLRSMADHLTRVEAERGRLIHLNLEPEPGCLLTTSQDLVEFFEQYLLPGPGEGSVRRHIRVCHDVCHAAVMFEAQADVLERYRHAGIEIGKVQLSSAIRARFDTLDGDQRAACLEQMRSFAEDRYLHQTVIQSAAPAAAREFVDDLPKALAMVGDNSNLNSQNLGTSSLGEWRVHFHVPLYLERFGWIETTQQEILDCMAAVRRVSGVKHFEAETYAWNVLPSDLQVEDLAAGIADEMSWVRRQAESILPA